MPEATTNLEQYPDRFLSCRVLNHAWQTSGLPWVEVKNEPTGGESQVFYEKLECVRCGNTRVDQRTMMGRFLRRSYRNQVNYRVSPEIRDRESMAGERIRRLLAQAQRSA